MKDAKELLAAATLKRECDDTIRRQDCKACDAWWPVVVPAKRAIERLGFSVKGLAVAIKLAEAHLERPPSEHDGGCCAGISKLPCECSQKDRAEALAAWEKLGE